MFHNMWDPSNDRVLLIHQDSPSGYLKKQLLGDKSIEKASSMFSEGLLQERSPVRELLRTLSEFYSGEGHRGGKFISHSKKTACFISQ